MYINQILRSARGFVMNVGMIPVGCVTTTILSGTEAVVEH
jgi:hypothetical protein